MDPMEEYLKITSIKPPKKCLLTDHHGAIREVTAINFDWPKARIIDGDSTYWTDMTFLKVIE